MHANLLEKDIIFVYKEPLGTLFVKHYRTHYLNTLTYITKMIANTHTTENQEVNKQHILIKS